jgi:rhodanese-related sulfurtransferase
VKFITTEGLLEMRANDQNFKLVEVLAREEFRKGHIPRAINIPLDQLPELSKEYLTKSDTVVVYFKLSMQHQY